MSAVHRQAHGPAPSAQWILAHSPYDTLVHAAQVFAYNVAGDAAISLACKSENRFSEAKLPRRRYEVHDQAVTCLTCLVMAT